MEKYQITRVYIYNFDEQKFIIGVSITTLLVMTLDKLKIGEIMRASQNKDTK